MTAFFDPQKEHLWIELTDGQLPPNLMAQYPDMFAFEFNDPKRVLVDMTVFMHRVAAFVKGS